MQKQQIAEAYIIFAFIPNAASHVYNICKTYLHNNIFMEIIQPNYNVICAACFLYFYYDHVLIVMKTTDTI